MKTKLLIVSFLFFSLSGMAQSSVTTEEFQILLGKWEGTLTYMDYTSNTPYSMPANVTVTEGKNKNQLILHNEYPNEPKANGKGKINLSKNGQAINGSDLISRENLENGDLELVTESMGKDNNEKALIRIVYVIGKDRFIMRKEVKFENSESWLQRNEFSYRRMN